MALSWMISPSQVFFSRDTFSGFEKRVATLVGVLIELVWVCIIFPIRWYRISRGAIPAFLCLSFAWPYQGLSP
ncbi:hypothetical protein B6D51_01385 [Pseudomonas chlororaphis subsp. chlororaphis]|nr:hypothetical protein B6D51_01385 [Pseudomonas chlororaphis subsp. chlororaphis]